MKYRIFFALSAVFLAGLALIVWGILDAHSPLKLSNFFVSLSNGDRNTIIIGLGMILVLSVFFKALDSV